MSSSDDGVFLTLLRGISCSLCEGGRGQEVHQAEETVRILGSIPFPEHVGIHRSGTGDSLPQPHLQPVNKDNKKDGFHLQANEYWTALRTDAQYYIDLNNLMFDRSVAT